MNDLTIDPAKQGIMDAIASTGAEHASQSLTKWFGKCVRISTSGFKAVPLDELSNMMCPPDEIIVAIHAHITGSLSGHVLLAFPENVAHRLVDCLMQQPDGTNTAFNEMEQSALQETGNIVSSSFINSLATSLGVRALPSTPQFLHDMAGAIIQPLVIEQLATSNNALMITATFEFDNSMLDWWLYVMPDPKSLKVMEALLS